MSLVLYSSSSDSNDDENDAKHKTKRFKPQLPSANIQLANEFDLSEKDFQTKNERSRLFPHERGNWALSIYAFVECSSHLDTMIDDLIEIFDDKWKRLMELHISLSKTIPIRFHHIESIRKGLQHELSLSMIQFSARIENVTILTNEDESTSFLVFTLDQDRQFAKLIEIIDKILREHRYPGYYANPCFHISFSYSMDKSRKENLPKDWKEKCLAVLKQYQCQPNAITIAVDDIRLKAGKRVYQLTKST
ncbi:unnamed protein product [Rotaria magnacalcarata]|uniref:U6 snRNA phosphodiesterase 1 n=4 Tax=Rotaria magnacalcarata TaxID=392030 RepID=A0A814MV44_9BILA|nr:unnamed protein product [Rotaria magnacalcarata]CAF1655459.1 unnamed protein product [Rotaria magnacalcarata]